MNKWWRIATLCFMAMVVASVSASVAGDLAATAQALNNIEQALAPFHGPKLEGVVHPTFDEWVKMCENLSSCLPNSPSYDAEKQTMLAKSLQFFGRAYVDLDTVAVYLAAYSAQFKNLYTTALTPELFESLFAAYMKTVSDQKPAVCRLDVPQGSIVVLRADLHGDVRSLMAMLSEMRQSGYMDAKDPFKISAPNVYALFLGDFTDRGLYGLEVIYTVLRLALANPERVILVRGNHETVDIVTHYGFAAEFMQKLYPASLMGEGPNATPNKAELARAVQKFKQFVQWYETMPLAVFLGSEYKNKKEYVQCCHGGLEPRFDARDLLAQASTTARLSVPYAIATNDFDPTLSAQSVVADLPGTDVTSSGFLWSDFTFDADEPTRHSDRGVGMIASRAFTQKLLTWYGKEGQLRVRGVIRGHQHSAQTIPLYLKQGGLYRHWLLLQQAFPVQFAMGNDLAVWTFNVAPDNLFGASCNFAIDTYAYLTIKGPFEEWQWKRVNNNLNGHD